MVQVARCLGILDEVNRMKVVAGVPPSSSGTNKNVRYMEVNELRRCVAWSAPKVIIYVCAARVPTLENL